MDALLSADVKMAYRASLSSSTHHPLPVSFFSFLSVIGCRLLDVYQRLSGCLHSSYSLAFPLFRVLEVSRLFAFSGVLPRSRLAPSSILSRASLGGDPLRSSSNRIDTMGIIVIACSVFPHLVCLHAAISAYLSVPVRPRPAVCVYRLRPDPCLRTLPISFCPPLPLAVFSIFRRLLYAPLGLSAVAPRVCVRRHFPGGMNPTSNPRCSLHNRSDLGV